MLQYNLFKKKGILSLIIIITTLSKRMIKEPNMHTYSNVLVCARIHTMRERDIPFYPSSRGEAAHFQLWKPVNPLGGPVFDLLLLGPDIINIVRRGTTTVRVKSECVLKLLLFFFSLKSKRKIIIIFFFALFYWWNCFLAVAVWHLLDEEIIISFEEAHAKVTATCDSFVMNQ